MTANLPDWPSLIRLNLFWGRDRAVTIGSIAETAKISRRTVEKAVETLRAEGQPICSGSSGVYLSSDPAELREQYQSLRRRYIRQAVNARVLLRTAKWYEKSQMTLWGRG